MGEPALVTDLFVPVHVVPRALALPFARAASLSRAPRDDDDNDDKEQQHDSRRQPCDGGFDDPRRVRQHAAREHPLLVLGLFVVHQHALAIRERRDARIRRNFRKNGHRTMARMGSKGRDELGTWHPLTEQTAMRGHNYK
jgi:hypothetical protein